MSRTRISPCSMRLAISTSPSRVSSETEPILRRYMRTGSLVREGSSSPSSSRLGITLRVASFGLAASLASSRDRTWTPSSARVFSHSPSSSGSMRSGGSSSCSSS